jgi:site-specific recombinase XerD
MASVYKKGGDKARKGTCYYVSWTDEHGKRRSQKAFTDKGLSEQLGAKLENEVMLRKRGLIDPEMDNYSQSQKSAIAGHVEKYRTILASRDATSKHIGLTISRVKAVIEGCGFKLLKDINQDKVSKYLQGLRSGEGRTIGHRTFNHYVQAFDGFCRWLVTRKKLRSNPVVGLERLNNEVDIRHRRRSLSPEEMAKLIQGARSSQKKIQDYTGELRAKLYLCAYLTGLRRKELASLTPESFNLKNNPPTLTVDAACSKHRKQDTLPLHPELVAMLSEWLPLIPSGSLLFPKLERKKTWFMVQKDLERVEIPYRTAEGVADFHAAGRHSHITEILRSGASLTEARELARHGDIRMTMRYTHIGIKDQANALAKLRVKSNPQSALPEGQQRLSSESGDSTCQNVTSSGESGLWESANENPCVDKGYRRKSPSDGECREWRRRESNEKTHF